MEVFHGHQHARLARSAVAIGNFDGVHLGHRALIDRARELAAANDAQTVALTFDPHPSAILGGRGPVKLATLERRIELLGEAGVEVVVVEPFTRELAGKAPDAFIDDVVLFALRAKAIVVGYDFTYGHARGGNTAALQAHGARAGVEVAILPAVEVDGAAASSTRIRGLLGEGAVDQANRLLGRPWDIDGTVVHGAKRGRTIGIPTANIEPIGDLLVPPGIYAVTLDGRAAVASLGRNPTFVDNGHLVLEVHVLDFDGDLYGRTVRTAFVGRLRDELAFSSVDALLEQIRVDIAQARQLLAKSGSYNPIH